jgi:hypothetical protein
MNILSSITLRLAGLETALPETRERSIWEEAATAQKA